MRRIFFVYNQSFRLWVKPKVKGGKEHLEAFLGGLLYFYNAERHETIFNT